MVKVGWKVSPFSDLMRKMAVHRIGFWLYIKTLQGYQYLILLTSTLKIKLVCSFKMSRYNQKTTWYNNLEAHCLNFSSCFQQAYTLHNINMSFLTSYSHQHQQIRFKTKTSAINLLNHYHHFHFLVSVLPTKNICKGWMNACMWWLFSASSRQWLKVCCCIKWPVLTNFQLQKIIE
jgi:hypothetical protein